jgi:hypothetical protein
MSWQFVGQQENRVVVRDITSSAEYSFELNGDEGNVIVRYTIWRYPVLTPAESSFCRVQFLNLDVRDDEEIGSGDWRIIARVNRLACFNSPEEHWSVGSGSSAQLNSFRGITLGNDAELVISCRVEEEDS